MMRNKHMTTLPIFKGKVLVIANTYSGRGQLFVDYSSNLHSAGQQL
jgi:hypothetical protein